MKIHTPVSGSQRRGARRRGRSVLGAGLGVGLLALAACSAPGSSGGGDTEALKLSMTHKVVFDVAVPDAVAQDQGLYEDAGVDIEPDRVYPSGSGDAVQTLISGSADIAVGVAFPAALSAIQQGADVKIVAAQYQGYGDITYYVPADSPLQSITDAGGASIASSGPGSTTDLVGRELQKQIEASGGSSPAIEALGSPPDVFTAVRTDQVDVGWTTPPFFFQEISDGTMRSIGTGNDADVLAGTTARVILARTDVVEDRAEDLQSFFDAYQSAIDYIYANTAETLEIWKSASEIDSSVELLEQAMEFYPEESLDLGSINGLDVLLRKASELGFLEGDLTEQQVQDAIVIDQTVGG